MDISLPLVDDRNPWSSSLQGSHPKCIPWKEKHRSRCQRAKIVLVFTLLIYIYTILYMLKASKLSFMIDQVFRLLFFCVCFVTNLTFGSKLQLRHWTFQLTFLNTFLSSQNLIEHPFGCWIIHAKASLQLWQWKVELFLHKLTTFTPRRFFSTPSCE